MRSVGVVAAWGLSLLTATGAWADDAALPQAASNEASVSDAQADDEAITPSQRALAASLSLFPGVLLHGSGNFALGRQDTALKLLAAEGAGITLLGAGGTILVLTGAARDWVAPAALLSVAGAGLFTMSWALDLYSVLAPEGGFGAANRVRPWFTGSLGYAHVYDPKFAYRNFATHELSARLDRVTFKASLWSSPDDFNQRGTLSTTIRALGHKPQPQRQAMPDGSALDVRLGLTEHRYPAEDFHITSFEWALRGRLDLFRYDRALAGSFAELEAGHAQQIFQWTSPSISSNEDLLLLRFGMGAYLGRHEPCGGEVQIYYDHRHDGYAAGLLVNGLGSGVLGHFGLEGDYFWSKTWGAGVLMEAGSAYVTALSLKVRAQ